MLFVRRTACVGGRMSYLRYLCLCVFACCVVRMSYLRVFVQHMLCCVFLLFVGGRMSYLRYLCLHAYSGVCCVVFSCCL